MVHVSLPMLSITYLVFIVKSYTLVKQEDNSLTDSTNTLMTQRKMSKTHPNHSQDTQQSAAFY